MVANRRLRRSARQLHRLCVVRGVLDQDRVRQVADRLAESNKRGALGVLTLFKRLVRLDRERRSARVETAVPLPDQVRAQVVGTMTRQYGADIETTFAENAALIGGMRVTVGSDVYDGSVRAKLDAIEAGL